VNVGPLGGYVRGDRHYSPSNDASFDNFGGGVRLLIQPNSLAVGTASALGHPPAHIELESVGCAPVQLNGEVYNAGVISH